MEKTYELHPKYWAKIILKKRELKLDNNHLIKLYYNDYYYEIIIVIFRKNVFTHKFEDKIYAETTEPFKEIGDICAALEYYKLRKHIAEILLTLPHHVADISKFGVSSRKRI